MKNRRTILLCIFLLAIYYVWMGSKAKEVSSPADFTKIQNLAKKPTLQDRKPASESFSQKQVAASSDTDLKKKKSLRDLLKDNDFCGFLQKSKHRFTEEEEDIIAEYLMGPRVSRDTNEEGDWTVEDYFTRGYGQSLTQRLGSRAEQILKFYNAMYWARYLYNYRPQIKLSRSHELLEELTQKYPQNGYFHLYLAAVKEQMKRPKRESDRHIAMALESEDFPDYELEIDQLLYEDTFTDRYVDVLAMASLQNGNVPSLDVSPIYKVLKSFIERQDDATAVKAEELAKKLMSEGQELYLEVDSYHLWSLRRYSLGKTLIFSAWNRFRPKEVVPAPWNIPINEMIKAFEAKKRSLYKTQFDLFDKAYKNESFCPLEEFIRYEKTQREIFYKFRKK